MYLFINLSSLLSGVSIYLSIFPPLWCIYLSLHTPLALYIVYRLFSYNSVSHSLSLVKYGCGLPAIYLAQVPLHSSSQGCGSGRILPGSDLQRENRFRIPPSSNTGSWSDRQEKNGSRPDPRKTTRIRILPDFNLMKFTFLLLIWFYSYYRSSINNVFNFRK